MTFYEDTVLAVLLIYMAAFIFFIWYVYLN